MAEITLEQPLLGAVADRPIAANYTAGFRPWQEQLDSWRHAHADNAEAGLGENPDWCLGIETVYPDSLRLLLLRGGGRDYPVPMLRKRCEFDCQLGELRLLRFRPWVWHAAAETPALPEDEGAYQVFLQALLEQSGSGSAWRFSLPTASRLWQFLTGPATRALPLLRYQPAPPAAHHLIRMPASFDAYISKFTSKTRKNRFRELRYLENRGAVELNCYRTPAEVEPFLAAASAISQASYQEKLLGVGLRCAAQLRPRLQIAAQQGWFRSYVLRCGGHACSFLLGYQYRHRYYYTKVGYDPAWQALCPGTVLQLLVLRALFEHDPPELFDLGSNGAQKQYFGNEQYEEGTVYFFRRGAYGTLLRSAHRGSRRLAAGASALLRQPKLQSRVQHLVRRLHGC